MWIEYIQENKNYYEERINELNDKVKYYQNKTQRQHKEIERLNNEIKTLLKENGNKEKVIIKQSNIINRMEIELKEMYVTFGEFNEEYTEKKIRELKGSEDNVH